MILEVTVTGLDSARNAKIDHLIEDLTFKTYKNNEESLLNQLEEISWENDTSIEDLESKDPNIYDITYDYIQSDFYEELNRMHQELIDNLQDIILSNDFTDLLIDDLNATYDYVVEPVSEYEFKTTSDKITVQEIKDFANKLFVDKFSYKAIDDIEFNDKRSFLYANYRMYYECDFNYALECMVEEILEKINIDLEVSDEI